MRALIATTLLLLVLVATAAVPTPGQSEARISDGRPRRVMDDQRPDSQDEKPLKLSANLVTVLASVSYPTGAIVNDLTKDDFQIFEDNSRQEVSGFYRENQIPLRLVFLFDTSSSIKSRFDFEKRAAGTFFRQVLRQGDEAAIYSVSSDPKLEMRFTSSQDTIASALDHLQPGGATALYSATLEAAKYLEGTPGRHVILVLSDGEDTSSATSLSKALTQVQRSDSVIYCVHSMGVIPSATPYPLSGESILKSMSDETGGLAFFPAINNDRKKETRELDDIYSRIANDIRGQYLLTYYSSAGKRDGLYRVIRLQLSRPGLNVRARHGYYAAQD